MVRLDDTSIDSDSTDRDVLSLLLSVLDFASVAEIVRVDDFDFGVVLEIETVGWERDFDADASLLLV